MSEAYVTSIQKGNNVIVNIPELNKELKAKVSFVGKNIDPLSRTFSVEIKLPSLKDLRPNMTGVVKSHFPFGAIHAGGTDKCCSGYKQSENSLCS